MEDKIKELFLLMVKNKYIGLDQKSKLDWIDVMICFHAVFGIDKLKEICGYVDEEVEKRYQSGEFNK